MSGLMHDLRFGARMLRRSPGTTVAAALTLSLGIASLTTIFSLLNGIILRPLAYGDPERLVLIGERSRDGGEAPVPLPNFLDWKSQSRSFQGLAAVERDTMVLTGGEVPERITVRLVSGELFGMLGVQPSLGRVFQKEENAAVLTDSLWERRFGRDPGVIGRVIFLNDTPRAIVGVLPREFRFFKQVDAFLPLQPGSSPGVREARTVLVIGRLAPGVTVHQVQAELPSITANLEPGYAADKPGWGVTVEKLQDNLVRGPRQDLPILLCAAAFVLLIACANVAGLTLAKTAARQHELAIRVSLGASRSRLLRQLIVESVLLALLAGGAGLCLSGWAVGFIRKQIPPGVIPNPEAVSIDGRVLGFTLAICLLTGIVFGLAPAWRASRKDVYEAMGRSSRGVCGRTRIRSALVVVELAMSVVLLSGAGLMMRAFAAAQSTDTCASPDRVLTMRISLPPHRYKDINRTKAFFQQTLEAMAALPSVQNSALATSLPFGDGPAGRFEVMGGSGARTGTASGTFIAVSDRFFSTLGVTLKRGRDFAASDSQGAAPVAIVNETLARRFLAGSEPVGQRLRLEDGTLAEIVGMIADIRATGRRDAEPPVIYVPYRQHVASEATVLLLAPTEAIPALMEAAPGAIRQIDKDQPVTDLDTLKQLKDRQMQIPRILTGLVASFGAMALLLALIGTYGLMSHAVTERTLEFGIRTALGAAPSDIYRMVGKQGIRLSLAGLALGFIGAVALSRLLRGLLFGVPVQDLLSIVGMAAVLLVGTLPVCYIPARRAARLDPATALRSD